MVNTRFPGFRRRHIYTMKQFDNRAKSFISDSILVCLSPCSKASGYGDNASVRRVLLTVGHQKYLLPEWKAAIGVTRVRWWAFPCNGAELCGADPRPWWSPRIWEQPVEEAFMWKGPNVFTECRRGNAFLSPWCSIVKFALVICLEAASLNEPTVHWISGKHTFSMCITNKVWTQVVV